MCRDPEVDFLILESSPQGERLLDTLLREALAGGHRADAVGDVRAGVAVSDEQQAVQKRTLR
jgi:hypothetical protein